MRKINISKKEKEIEHARTDAEWQISELDDEERQLLLNPPGPISQSAVNLPNPLSELQSDLNQVRKTLQDYVELCKDVKTKVYEKRTGQIIRNIRTDVKGRAAVGMINMDGDEANISQNIQDVSTGSEAKSIVGMARNVDFTEFWK